MKQDTENVANFLPLPLFFVCLRSNYAIDIRNMRARNDASKYILIKRLDISRPDNNGSRHFSVCSNVAQFTTGEIST